MIWIIYCRCKIMSDKKRADEDIRPYNIIFDTVLFRILLIIYALIFLYTAYIIIKIYPPYPPLMNSADKISAVKSLTIPWIILSICITLININVKKLKFLTICFILSNAIISIICRILIESIDITVVSYLISTVWLYFLMLSAVFLLDDLDGKRYKILLISAVIVLIILYLIVFMSAIIKSYVFVFVLLMFSLPIIVFANIILFFKKIDKPAMITIYLLSIICNSYNIFWKILPDNGVYILANIIISTMITSVIGILINYIKNIK